MSVPDWWEATLLALAAWRVFQLIAEDTILDRPRRYVTARLDDKWELFILCAYCFGAWLSLVVYLLWLWQPKVALVFGTLSALNAAVIALDRTIGMKD